MAFTVDIRGNASHLEKTLNSVKGSIVSLGSVAKTGAAGLAGLGAAGAAGLGAFVVSSSKAAMNIEVMTMQFATLLGGADAAGKRMEEIIEFAASTPFEIPELVATSKLLQTLGGTMLATGEGLRMVGDAAAISGQPLEEVGRHIGRVFNAITTGNSAGESVARLQELGLIGGEVKREFENLAAAQKKGEVASLTSAQAMAKLKGVFKQTEGAMLELSSTTSGKLSNMKDNIGKLQVAFGKGFNDGFRDALDSANNFLPQLESKFTEVGDIIGSAITQAISGNTKELAAVGGFIGELIVAGLQASVIAGLDNLGTLLGKGLAYSAENFSLSSFVAPEEAKKIGAAIRDFTSSGTTFSEQLDSAMAKPSSNLAMLQGSRTDRQSSKIARKLGQEFNQNLTTPMMGMFGNQTQDYSARNSFMKPDTFENAVTQGVLKAFLKQAPGAKFTN
ncbi:MAG: hypothetical protein ACK48S_03255 [Planctomycetia bacterium]